MMCGQMLQGDATINHGHQRHGDDLWTLKTRKRGVGVGVQMQQFVILMDGCLQMEGW